MRSIMKAAVIGLLSLACPLPSAQAHYLWVTIDTRPGEHGAAKIYFEEGPSAGDGHYLDHFSTTSKTWFRTIADREGRVIEPSDIKSDTKRWLEAELPAAAPRSVDCYGKFGVYTYGDTKVLLHYYARALDVATREDLRALGRAEQMDLDIAVRDRDDDIELTVHWRGKPAAGRTVLVLGPKRFRQDITTDENGIARFTPADTGRYVFRTNVEEPTPGRDGDDDYALVRHHATLVMTLPLQK